MCNQKVEAESLPLRRICLIRPFPFERIDWKISPFLFLDFLRLLYRSKSSTNVVICFAACSPFPESYSREADPLCVLAFDLYPRAERLSQIAMYRSSKSKDADGHAVGSIKRESLPFLSKILKTFGL